MSKYQTNQQKRLHNLIPPPQFEQNFPHKKFFTLPKPQHQKA